MAAFRFITSSIIAFLSASVRTLTTFDAGADVEAGVDVDAAEDDASDDAEEAVAADEEEAAPVDTALAEDSILCLSGRNAKKTTQP
jgi:hypothetical protein